MLQSIETGLYEIAATINNYLSNYILAFLLLGVGIGYTVTTRFVQVRCFGEGMKRVFGSFVLEWRQTGTWHEFLSGAVNSHCGTGGNWKHCRCFRRDPDRWPWCDFWMWVIAFFGMATIYAEATLALKTRVIDKDGTIHGGPVYYITAAFKGGFGKFLAGFLCSSHHFDSGIYGLHGAGKFYRLYVPDGI